MLKEIQAKPSSGCNNEFAIFRTVSGFSFALHAPQKFGPSLVKCYKSSSTQKFVLTTNVLLTQFHSHTNSVAATEPSIIRPPGHKYLQTSQFSPYVTEMAHLLIACTDSMRFTGVNSVALEILCTASKHWI